MKQNAVLTVQNLQITSQDTGKTTPRPLLHGSSFAVYPGECLGILGESGSGKSLTIQGALGLLTENFTVTGQVYFNGQDLLQTDRETLRQLRGEKIAMVLQNPMTAFDPLCRIGEQIAETFAAHNQQPRAQRHAELLALFNQLQLPQPQEILAKYPHQLSGGMLQRIMIALALVMNPQLLIADEPTTALDAITQYEVLTAFHKIKEKHQTAMIFISHDLGAISYLADRMLVMNQGRIVDEGNLNHILHHAKDPYTQLLIAQKSAVMARYRACLGQLESEESAC